MALNFGAGSSSSLGESPTSASETIGGLAMEVAESPNNAKTAKPPKPSLKRKQRSDVWNHYRVEFDGSITSDGYISLTCHFIDEDRVLQKFVLNFSLMPSPHTGAALSNKLFSMLCDWGIENKVFSLTLDNASANDLSVELLLTQMNVNNSLLSNGEFFHIRCCAHIVNLVVQVGLKDIEQSVVKIRESVKYVRGSQTRKQNFLECVSKVGLDRKRGLRQDFVFWKRYPTSNLYFRPVVMCYSSLRQHQNSSDPYLKKMAELMLPKFEKYWSDFSMILTIAVVFDPRYKLQFVDFFYKKLYGPDSRQFSLVKEKLFALFEDYCNSYNDKFDVDKNGNSTASGQNCDFTNADSMAMVEEFNSLDVEFGLSQQKSQLELYMEEKRLDVKSNLDILNYWKGSQFKYPYVACMARDILSIPITTVASESVFSVGGRVLDQYRSSLKPSNAEAIICTRDWLFGKKGIKGEIPTNDLAEDFLNVDDEPHTGSSAT
ncbi:zinc finger BED domain-containing protein RICESLEEPER 2-like [Salvia hispanica]|uniref:zinc finger BED domain-containing protein RICESLEEPER 2-like n=1 Tax=Salvia hispanica TaxID=49212 RepID=UPI002009B8C6|nr:zinc finger BED domain-containing protein RICESLEEPER 2-like [Salvia hispanica]